MSEPVDPPAVDGASVTAAAPPRKRRRPALSCEQCRRRKIKCDRIYPCGQCLQSKTASCTYSPDSVPGVGHVNRGGIQKPRQAIQEPRGESTLGRWAKENGISIPNRSRATLAVDPMTAPKDNQSSSTTSPKGLTSSDDSRTSLSSPATDPIQEFVTEENNKELLGRILEKLSETKASADGSTVQREEFKFSLEQKDHVRGTVSKTRFFGQSHWMYSFGAVSSPLAHVKPI